MAFDPKLFQGPVHGNQVVPVTPQLPALQQTQLPAEQQQSGFGGWLRSIWDKIKALPGDLWQGFKGLWESGKQFLGGTPGGYEQISMYEPHQRNALNFVLSDALQNLQNPQQGFEPIAELARTQFNERTVPDILSNFSGRLSSPDLGKQLRSGAQGLDQFLAAQRAQYGYQNRNQALQQLQLGLTPQTSMQYIPGKGGALEQIAPIATKAAATALL